MLFKTWQLSALGALIVCGLNFQTLEAHPFGPPRRHHHYHHHHGPSSTAAVAFAVGAVATMLSPPPPAPVIVHQHGYGPYGPPPRPYYYPAPVVQREIIYRDPPAPIIVTPAAPAPASAPQPVLAAPANGPVLKPIPDPNISLASTRPAVGTVVDRLPPSATRAERGGVMYFEQDGIYYLPVQFGNESKFVVVQPQ